MRLDELLRLGHTDVDASGGLWRPDGWELVAHWQRHLLVQHVKLPGDGQLLSTNLVFQQLALFPAHFPRFLRVPVAQREGGQADGGEGKRGALFAQIGRFFFKISF